MATNPYGLGYGPPPSATAAVGYQRRAGSVPAPSGGSVVQQTRIQMPPTLTPDPGYAVPRAATPLTYTPAWHPDAGQPQPPGGIPWALVIAGAALAVFTSS